MHFQRAWTYLLLNDPSNIPTSRCTLSDSTVTGLVEVLIRAICDHVKVRWLVSAVVLVLAVELASLKCLSL